jgi:predicted nucleic acid-binding protein
MAISNATQRWSVPSPSPSGCWTPPKRAQAALERINLIPLSPEIIELATDAHTPPLRAMDAIHLATALTMREDLGAMFVYDSDLHAAAQAHHLNPTAPQ